MAQILLPASRLARGRLISRGMRLQALLRPQPYYRQLHASVPLHQHSPPPIRNKIPDPNENEKKQNEQQKKNDEKARKQDEPLKKKSILGRVVGVLITVSVLAFIDPMTLHRRYAAPPISEIRFKPFTVVAHEQISSTAFIITVAPKRLPSNLTFQRKIMKEMLRRGVWAVEVKQPQLQVARDYTPLPPMTPEEEEDMVERFQLRFLIRRMESGEVSNYISRLQVGDEIELRGHKLGFDVNERLGETGDQVVFLAGGTGIASALQVARAVLDPSVGDEDGDSSKRKQKRHVNIIWANRRREDCDDSNRINRMLEQMRQRYGHDRFSYVRTVDEEKTFIDAKAIGRTLSNDTPTLEAPSSSGCNYHSTIKLITSPAQDPETRDIKYPEVRDDQLFIWYHEMKSKRPKFEPPPKCQCRGKNLVMISGPDGFVEYLAGKKIWAQGKELQGPIGGVIGKMEKKYPELAEKWLVLKM